jgi:hypothetical protein
MALIAVPVRYQGEGIPVGIITKEVDGVTRRPLSDFTNIYVEVSHYPSGAVIGKFSRVAQEGFDVLNWHDVDIAEGEAEVICQPSKTLVGAEGEYKCVVKTKETDSRFDDNTLPVLYEEKVFYLKSNSLKNA